MNKQIPTPRTDSGWSWADFWNWYKVQSLECQQWTFNVNDLLGTISAMAEDVQNEALYYAPADVQALFGYGISEMDRRRMDIRARIDKITRSL